MNVLQLGIPKGSLENATVELFRLSGWKIGVSGRSYFPSVDDPGLRCLLVRAQEMARYVESGVLDAGITGRDWVFEYDAKVHVAQELVYSKASLRPTRWVLVVAGDSPVKKPRTSGQADRDRLVGCTTRWFGSAASTAHRFSWGATEAKSRRARRRDRRGDGDWLDAARARPTHRLRALRVGATADRGRRVAVAWKARESAISSSAGGAARRGRWSGMNVPKDKQDVIALCRRSQRRPCRTPLRHRVVRDQACRRATVRDSSRLLRAGAWHHQYH
jgi:ATP phosphoribosyltransferase